MVHGRSGEERTGDRIACLSPRVACSIIPAKMIKKSRKRRTVSINGKEMTAEFNWDDARIFLAIARAGTLSGAADKMNMGIATVSRRLDRLEQSLKVPLFSRHQSGYRLTTMAKPCSRGRRRWNTQAWAFGEAAQLQGHVAGVVRLATSDNLATHFILPLPERAPGPLS
ncbi:LysR family transcriptional regulator [Klebsiella variicola]|nr:LysR family transcriptional regulator [Klebsiella variicola]